MFLIQRIFGVSIYFITLMIICLLIYNSKNFKQRKNILIIYILLLSIMAYFFVPNIGSDLYRTYELVHIYSTESLSSFFNRIINASTPASLIYFRYIGKIGIDNLLPFITTIICYSNILYILYDYSKKKNISSKSMSLCLLSIMGTSSFMLTIANIRTMIAFSILAKCFYDEIFNKKNIIKNIHLYILACLFHNTATILSFLRFVIFLFNNKNKRNLLISVLNKFLIAIVILFAFIFGKDIILSISDKANSYLLYGTYSYIWENVIGWLYLLFLIRTLFTKSLNNFFQNNKEYKISLFVLIIIILIFNFEHSIFTRFISFAQIVFIPTILNRIELIVTNKKSGNYNFIVFYLLIILLISCVRGNLCSLKFWS